ncbi:MAG: hypothetical protein FWH38_10110 [Treponema sp.]|nr:hypothetical protein [Treponema sp.]
MKRTLLLFLLVFSCGLAFSLDFGLLADQAFEAENDLTTYTPALAPWLSWDGGGRLSVYFSGVFSFKYSKSGDGDSGNGGWRDPALLPELSLFALTYRASDNFSLEAGRVNYADALGVTASGLFDGIRFSVSGPNYGSLSAGAYYSGLQYKETAEIIMTGDDMIHYSQPWSTDESGSYFASRRLFAALRWDAALGELNALSAEALFQFDLNDTVDTLHSQYGEILAEFFPRYMMRISAGAFFEVMERSDGDASAAFGALAGFRMDLPGAMNHGINLATQYSSGSWNDNFSAFTPISSHTQGMVFPGTFSGLWIFSAEYSARLFQALFGECSLRYFAKTYEESGDEGQLYGGELWASLAWQPLNDVRLIFGGGVFIPGTGNYYPADTDPLWKISAGLSLSF